MKKVLIVLDLNQRQIDMYKDPELELTFKKPSEVTPADLKEVNILVGNIPPAVVKEAPHLELINLNSAGYDNYLGYVSPNTKLCNCVGAFSPAVGEHILAMTFSLIRHFHLYRDKQDCE